VPLKHAVPSSKSATAAPSTSASTETASPPAAAVGEDLYYHKKVLSKEESGALVLKPGTGDGTFLVYDHTTGDKVLCVVYKGKATNHLITVVDGQFLINKKAFVDASSLDALVSGLGKPGVPKWPVPLAHPVAPPKVDPAIEAAAAAAAAAAEAAEIAAAAAATRADLEVFTISRWLVGWSRKVKYE
jgi:hypothetical protein